MPNPFDQFDAPARANPFDQFDGGTATAVAEAPDPRRAAKGRALRGELMAERRSGYGADALMAGAGGAEFVVDAASKMITSFPRAAYAVSEMITPTGQPFVDRPTIEKWTPEMAATVRRAIGGPGSTDISGDETAAGVANAVSDFGEFFTTPEGVATLGAGAAPALARAALGAGFAGQMSSHVPEAFAQAGELSAGDDRAEAVRFGLGALGTAVFAGAIPIGAIKHQSTPRVLPPAERAGKMLEAAVNDPALLDRFEQVANELALERSAPESAQRGVVSGQRPAPAGLFTAEDFNPFDRFDKPPSPPETLPPEAAPASQLSTPPLSTAPALRGEAAMETRPTAEMGLDRTQPSTLNPELSTDLADTIAALRAGYRPEVEKLPEPVAAPFPPYAEKLGIKSWQQAKKLGLDTIITDAPDMAREVVRAASNWINASPERAAEYIAGEIVARTRLLGGRETALRSLANDYYQKAKGATEPGQQQRFNATAQALEALQAKPVESSPAPSSNAQEYSKSALQSAFNLTPEQAVATDAIVKAMGLDESKIRVAKGGEAGGDALLQMEDVLSGKEKVPHYDTIAKAVEFIRKYAKANQVIPKGVNLFSSKGRASAVDAIVRHTLLELAEWKKISGDYTPFYTTDILERTNPALQRHAVKKYGRKLSKDEVAFTHLLSAFGSGQAEPTVDTITGMRVFDEYMRTGRATGYSDKPKPVYKAPAVGESPLRVFVDAKTGEDTFVAKGNAPKFDDTRKAQISKTYNVSGLARFNRVLEHFNGDLAETIQWLGSQHKFSDIRAVIGDAAADSLKPHEYLNKNGLTFGTFVLGNNPKLGSYILNRWQKLGTITKDMWVARTMSRYFREPNTGEPWATTAEGNNKRRILDEAWGIVAVKLGVDPAQVQEMMWDAEKKIYSRFGQASEGAYTSQGVEMEIARHKRNLAEAVGAKGSEGAGILLQGVKGAAEFAADGKAIIRGFQAADVSTGIHEVAHVARRQLFDRSLTSEQRAGITDADIATAEEWAGADGLRGWDRVAEEKFARGFERYLRDGKAPTEALAGVFSKFKDWLKDIYRRITGSDIDVRVSPEMKAVFDRLVTRSERSDAARSFDINTGSLGESGMGGAKPGEFAGNSGTPTGIKNATVDAERARRGLPPAMESARRDWGSVWDEAMARIDNDPALQDQLIAELKAKPRALTDTEGALLAHRQIDLQNEYDRLNRELAVAYEDSKAFPNRLADMEAIKARRSEVSDQLLDVYDVGKLAGSENARGLAFRKAMFTEHFTLAAMEMEKRAALGGAPLTDAERSAMGKLHERIVELEAKAVAREEQVATERASRMTDEAIADMKRELASKPSYSPQLIKIAEEILGKLKVQANKSRDHFKGRVLSLSPEDIYHLGVIGAEKIARTGLDVTKFGLEMAAEFGDGITPYIKAVWDRANLHLDNEGAKYGDKSEPVKRLLRKRDAAGQREGVIEGLKKAQAEGLPVELLGDYVRKLALSFVRAGVAERNALVDAVHKVLTEDIGMELSRRETMDAISGYGRFKPLDADAAKAQLRDLKGQMQQVAKLEDITAKKPLQKTGVERRSQSDEERRLIQQVNEAKRRHGVVVTDPARQLKSALAARTTALKHRKADLEYQIATRERIVKTKTPTPFDAETKLLEVEVENLTRQLDELVPRPGITDGQRSALAERSVEREIAVLEEQIKTGDVKARTARPIMSTAKLESLKARREALRAERQELRELDGEFQRQQAEKSLAQQKASLEAGIAAREKALAEGPKPPVGREVSRPADPALESLMQKRDALNRQLAEARKPKGTPEDRALKALHTRLTTSAAEYAARLARGDFAPRVRKPVPTDPTTLRLKAEAERAKVEWREGLERDRFRNLSFTKKAIEHAKEVLNLPRAVLASWDVSAVLRQGGFITLNPRNYRRAASGLAPMFRALASETRAHMVEKSIRDRPNAPLYDRAKLYLASLDTSKLTAMEELFMSRMSRAIPGVRASERAYITFLNKLRADSFDAMVDRMQAKGTPLTDLELQAVGNFVNVSTGRGDMGARAAAADTLATIFFSPRLVVSRFQLLTGQPLRKAGTLRVARAVAAEYAGFLSGLAVVYALANMAGAEVETDPRSSDFGKLRFGNTRVDPLAGLAQVTGLLSRLGTGETKSISGKVKPIVGDLPYGADTAPDVIFRFLRTKLSPVVGAAVDLRQGENVVGEKVSSTTTLQRMAVPLSFQEIYKVMLADGIPKGTALGILSLFGWGLQQHDDRKFKK